MNVYHRPCVGASSVTIGGAISLGIDPTRMHLFDAASGAALF
jgi:hypothetical protein